MKTLPIILAIKLALLALIFTTIPVAAQTESPRATVRIHLKEEKAPVPPTLYGIFMEEISHAFDGGTTAITTRSSATRSKPSIPA